MPIYYVGPGGNDANDGLSWANRFETLNGCEDEPVAAEDICWIAPGVYRETLTLDVSGGNAYTTGTVSVTNGSTTVEGAGGMDWTGGNANAGGYFHIRYYDQGTDGDTDGTAAFAATAGNFHANLVGCPIQINAKGAYTISAVADADNLTLADPNAIGWPATSGGGFNVTYSIMSGEGHHEIASITDADTLELVQPWQGKTHTGMAYVTFDAISYIADVTGERTDGVGGVVRITGSDNDQTSARANCIIADNKDYRVFRGFAVDMGSNYNIKATNASEHIVLEDIMVGNGAGGIALQSAVLAATIRRCKIEPFSGYALYVWNGSDVDDVACVIENTTLISANDTAQINNVGGITFRNCELLGGEYGIYINAALTVGQTVAVFNSIFTGLVQALRGSVAGEITEDYNTLYGNQFARINVATGANSVTYPTLFLPPILHAGADQLSGFRFPPPLLGELSEWSQLQIAGVDGRNTDMLGNRRPFVAAGTGSVRESSWGPLQFVDVELETTVVQAGSTARSLNDAGFKFVRRVPCTNVETTVTLYLRRETNYAGSLPWMVLKQPGQADRTTIMTAAVDNWEQMSDTFTPAALPGYFEVWVESRNTAGAGDYEVLYDTLVVS